MNLWVDERNPNRTEKNSYRKRKIVSKDQEILE